MFASSFLLTSRKSHRSAADPLGLALECLLLEVKNFLCPWLPAQRLCAHLGSSCHPSAGCPSRSCTEAHPPGSCKSAHILHCPHTSPALKDSPGQVTCRQSSSSTHIYGQGFTERSGKGKGLVLSSFLAVHERMSLWTPVIMAAFANWGPQTGVLKLLVHQVHIIGTTHPRVSLNLQIPLF